MAQVCFMAGLRWGRRILHGIMLADGDYYSSAHGPRLTLSAANLRPE